MKTELIPRRKLSTEVRDRLLATIREGEFRPGDRLPSERELMTKFGVGRPAVREALQSLQNDGLIEISHGERARVVPINARDLIGRIGETALHLLRADPQTLEHLREARLLFETGMVRIAAQKAIAEDISRLEESLERQQQASRDPDAFVRADMAFHATIATISRNPIFSAVSESMLDWLFRFRHGMLRVPGAEKITLAEHRRISQAIRDHDPDEAVEAMRAHITRADKRYRALENAGN